MGMDAELLAMGRFSQSVVGFLQYPADFYAGIPDDAIIITHVCNAVTSRGSELLAKALGIDPWRFDQHCYRAGVDANLSELEEAIENPEDVVRFLGLREAGFMFHYLPNG
jgi:hypothetical protein